MTSSTSYPENVLVRLQRQLQIPTLTLLQSIAWQLLTVLIYRATIANPNGHESRKKFQHTILLRTPMYYTKWGRVILWAERLLREMQSERGKLIGFGLRILVDLAQGWRSMRKAYNSLSWLDSFSILSVFYIRMESTTRH